jgi:hypothetical protein
MLTTIAIHTAPKIRSHLKNFMDAVYIGNEGIAAQHLDRMECAIIEHYNSRGMSCDGAKTTIEAMRYWLDRNVTIYGKRREIEKLVIQLEGQLVVRLPSDPLQALAMIFENLRSAWQVFIIDRRGENAEMINDYLNALYLLESKFKALTAEQYADFRKVLELAGSCSSKVYLALQATVAEKISISIITSFDELFKQISALLAPEHYEARQAQQRPSSQLGQ